MRDAVPAFCAIVAHYVPEINFEAQDFDTPQGRTNAFNLAFDVAERRAGCPQFLDAADMIEDEWRLVDHSDTWLDEIGAAELRPAPGKRQYVNKRRRAGPLIRHDCH